MKKIILGLFLLAGCHEISTRYNWFCDNHREYIGDHNFGKGHLCIDENCRREASAEHGCKGWRAVKVIVD